jgi:hypothetical protein
LDVIRFSSNIQQTKPLSTADLLEPERRLLLAMHDVWFGRFQNLRVRGGVPVLDPPPTAVRLLKFNAGSVSPSHLTSTSEFLLKQEVAELFQSTRSMENGQVLLIEVRHGTPILVEIEAPGLFKADERVALDA